MSIDRKNAIPDSTLLIDWISSIYGVFWGIWLGFFVEQLGKNTISEIIPKKIASVIPIGFSLLLILFIYNFIKWVWLMRYIGDKSKGYEIFLGIKKCPLFIITVVGIYFFGYLYNIDMIWRNMGAWATIAWPFVIIISLISDKRGWLK